MRYYSFAEFWPNDDGTLQDEVVTLSEEDIRKSYWPYWYGRMCEKFPALQKKWDEFKMIYELCRSQDDIDRQNP